MTQGQIIISVVFGGLGALIVMSTIEFLRYRNQEVSKFQSLNPGPIIKGVKDGEH